MLSNVGGHFYRIVSWRVAVPAYKIFDFIGFPLMRYNSIQGILFPHISYLLLCLLRVCCMWFFSFSVGLLALPLVVLGTLSFPSGLTLPRSTENVLQFLSLPILIVVGEASSTRNGAVLNDRSLQYDVVAMRPAAEVIIGNP